MTRHSPSTTPAEIAECIEYGFYDQLTLPQLAAEVQARGIDSNTARRDCSFIQLLLRDDQPGKRAAIIHNQQNVTFINLPAEIRNRIYRLFIHQLFRDFKTRKLLEFGSYCRTNAFYEPGIMGTCNLIRREMLPMHYTKRRVTFCGPLDAERRYKVPGDIIDTVKLNLRRWLSNIGAERLNATMLLRISMGGVHLEVTRARYYMFVGIEVANATVAELGVELVGMVQVHMERQLVERASKWDAVKKRFVTIADEELFEVKK